MYTPGSPLIVANHGQNATGQSATRTNATGENATEVTSHLYP